MIIISAIFFFEKTNTIFDMVFNYISQKGKIVNFAIFFFHFELAL